MKYFWHQATLLRIALPLITGVVVGFYLPQASYLYISIGILLTILISGYFVFREKWKYYKNRYLIGFLINTAFLLAGMFLAVGKSDRIRESLELPPEADYYSAELVDFPHIGENSIRLDLEISSYADSMGFKSCNPVRIFAYTAPELGTDSLIPGDILLFSSKLSRNTEVLNPGQFDYSQHLRNRGIAATTYIGRELFVGRSLEQEFRWSFLFKNIQTYCVNVFASVHIPERELGVASALVLGKRTLIDPKLKSEYSEVGAIHILAVSGLHVGIIYIVIVNLLGRIFRAKKWRPVIFIISLLFLWTYAGITGFSPSVLRATVMFSFIALGMVSDQRGTIYNLLAASAIVLIIYNPAIVREVGFQLSYLAVLGISYFYKPIYELRIFRYWLPDKIWSLLVVAFTAQISTFPLSIYYFGQFPNYFLPTNILVIPAAMIALYSGLLLLILHWIPIAGVVFGWILKWDIWILNTFIEWMASLPMALSDHLYLSIFAVILLYLFIASGANLLKFPSRRNLIAVGSIALLLTTMWNYRKFTISERVEVAVLRVNRSDAICLQRSNTAYVFVRDTSESAIQKHRFYLDGYFDRKGIDSEVWLPFEVDFYENEISGRNGFINFDSFRFSIANNSLELEFAKALSVDFVLITNEFYDSEFQFENQDMIHILSTELAPWIREKIILQLDSAGARYWDLESQGIFSL